MKKWWMSFLFSSIFCIANGLNIAPKVEGDLPEKPIVVVIASYNNAHICIRNLESVFSQSYTNYRVIYTNDASTDATQRLVATYKAKKGFDDNKFKVITNRTNKGAASNQHRMIHMCNKDDIVIILDGDDILLGSNVFQRINRAYADENVWVSYAQFSTRNSSHGESVAIPQYILRDGLHRDLPWKTYGLRNFYAGLYKSIDEHKWLYYGKHFPMTIDVLQMFYLMDLAREHTYFIEEPLMYYNLDSPINDSNVRRKKQKKLENYMRALKPLDKMDSMADFL